jgi:hypothetical protein
MNKPDTIPKLHIIIRPDAPGANGSIRYWWSVTMMASDATRTRSLGYRGTGIINEDLTGLEFERGPEVHDENLPRWTPMNSTDRPDIRKQIIRLATNAVGRLKKGGEDKFEHVIP